MRVRITWNWLWWRVIRCRSEGVKEGHEEWEGTWERKREVEMKEWQFGTIMYIDDRPDKRRIQRRSSFCLSWKLILPSIALFSHD
jgi:hypothetical protein